MEQQLGCASSSSSSRSRGWRSSAAVLRPVHRTTSRASRFVARCSLPGLLLLSFLDLPPQHPLGRRTSSFNLLALQRHVVLALTIPAQRDTLILELVGVNATNMQEQIFFPFSPFATLQARRAARGLSSGRRPSPHAQPSHPSPFSPLPPFLYSLPCPGRGCGWVWLGREGREGSSSRSSTSLPPRAHSTLA